MSDAYRDFRDLENHQVEGRDFEVEQELRDSGILFLAPHGGGIEPGTTPLVKAAAGTEHSYYCFNGIKDRGNWCLHLTSTRFDEPRGVEAVTAARRVVAIHGASGRKKEWAMIGGRDAELAARITTELEERGFEVRPCEEHMSAQSVENICNKSQTGRGVQVELSRALRDHLRKNSRAKDQFTEALRRAVAGICNDEG